MIRMRKFINNLSRFQKIAYSIIALFLLCALPIAIRLYQDIKTEMY